MRHVSKRPAFTKGLAHSQSCTCRSLFPAKAATCAIQTVAQLQNDQTTQQSQQAAVVVACIELHQRCQHFTCLTTTHGSNINMCNSTGWCWHRHAPCGQSGLTPQNCSTTDCPSTLAAASITGQLNPGLLTTSHVHAHMAFATSSCKASQQPLCTGDTQNCSRQPEAVANNHNCGICAYSAEVYYSCAYSMPGRPAAAKKPGIKV